jgi:AraC-like DNA-binding protein
MKFFDIEILRIVGFAILPQIFFAIAFLLFKRRIEKFNVYGACFFVSIGLLLLREIIVFYHSNPIYPIGLRIFVYPLLLGPMLYLYTKNLLNINKNDKMQDWMHFVTFALVSGIYIVFYSDSRSEAYQIIAFDPFLHPSWQGRFIGLLYFLSFVFYTKKIISIMKIYVSELKYFYSTMRVDVTLSWLYAVIIVFYSVIFILGMMVILIRLQSVGYFDLGLQRLDFQKIFWSLIGFCVYVTSFFMIQQNIPEIIQSREEFSQLNTKIDLKDNGSNEQVSNIETSSIENQSQLIPNETKDKYKKSGLNESQKLTILQNLQNTLEVDRLYLDEDINLKMLASRLQVSVNHLSQTINETMDKNFYQFINEYRIEEVLRKLEDPSFKELNILEIAFSSGFNSKSSFNNFFKKKTGMSPSEYRKKIQTH